MGLFVLHKCENCTYIFFHTAHTTDNDRKEMQL